MMGGHHTPIMVLSASPPSSAAIETQLTAKEPCMSVTNRY